MIRYPATSGGALGGGLLRLQAHLLDGLAPTDTATSALINAIYCLAADMLHGEFAHHGYTRCNSA